VKREKIIIDTDAGIDDAMAMFLAIKSDEIDIVGITTVFGNTYVENSTRNVFAVLAAAERDDIPVAEGAGSPIARAWEPRTGKFHGHDGLGGGADQLVRLDSAPLSVSAAQFIVEKIMARPGEITIAALGPVTNLALALRLKPDITKYVKRVVLLGGAFWMPGNATPTAEANFHNDPESAQIVCGAAWEVTLVGLNVTTRINMTNAYVEQLCSRHSRITEFIAKTVPFYQRAYALHHEMDKAIYCHDATLIAYLVKPELFSVQRIPICIQTDGKAAGMTIRDDKQHWADSSYVNVCTDVESDSVLSLYSQRVSPGAYGISRSRGLETSSMKRKRNLQA
jgi:inosine-uridine nucleoside N-ribohydrolase